jgi:hypothetical protein
MRAVGAVEIVDLPLAAGIDLRVAPRGAGSSTTMSAQAAAEDDGRSNGNAAPARSPF